MTLLASLLGPLFGSGLGLLGAWVKGKQDLEVKKLELDDAAKSRTHELLLRDKDIEVSKAEAQSRKDVAIIEGESQIESSRFAAIAEIEKSDQVSADEIKAAGGMSWLLVIVSAMRKSVRPVLTYALVGSSLWLNAEVLGYFLKDWQSLNQTQKFDAGMQSFAWVTTQASAIITYWFMTRKSTN
jgi:hypothetical protein